MKTIVFPGVFFGAIGSCCCGSGGAVVKTHFFFQREPDWSVT